MIKKMKRPASTLVCYKRRASLIKNYLKDQYPLFCGIPDDSITLVGIGHTWFTSGLKFLAGHTSLIS